VVTVSLYRLYGRWWADCKGFVKSDAPIWADRTIRGYFSTWIGERLTIMEQTLEARRLEILGEMAHVNRAIRETEEEMADMQARLAVLSQAKTQAA
jgi:hypothetical protein